MAETATEHTQEEVLQHGEMAFEPAGEPNPSRSMRSPFIGKLVAALAKAQTEFQPIKKNLKNPYYSSYYADLAQVIEATQPALAKNGLVVIQLPNASVEAQQLTLTTIMAHESGEWVGNEFTLPAIMAGRDGKMRFDSQSVGAAMTYARRYTYQAIVGVTAEVDDDANLAIGGGSKEAAQQVAEQKKKELQAKLDAHKSEEKPVLFLIWNEREGRGSVPMRKEQLSAFPFLEVVKYRCTWTKDGFIFNAEGFDGLKHDLEGRATIKMLEGVQKGA